MSYSFSYQGKARAGWEVQSCWQRLNGQDRLQERLDIPPLCCRRCLQVWGLDLLLLCWWPDGGGETRAHVHDQSEERTWEKVVNEDKNSCVDATASSWEMLVDSDWQQDETATVTCARLATWHGTCPYVGRCSFWEVVHKNNLRRRYNCSSGCTLYNVHTSHNTSLERIKTAVQYHTIHYQSIFLLLLRLHSLIDGWHRFQLSRGHLVSTCCPFLLLSTYKQTILQLFIP